MTPNSHPEPSAETSPELEHVTLYRGLAVPFAEVQRVTADIIDHGLCKVDAMHWGSTMASPLEIRRQAVELGKTPGTIRDRIQEMSGRHVICGCGDILGATIYAQTYSRTDDERCCLLITYSMPVGDLIIDGKDFLYTVFQFWDRNHARHREIVRDVLEIIFGKSILPYFDAAAGLKDTIERVGICDLACVDVDVIRVHAQNSLLVHGRYNTKFCSAFQMQAPVPAERIISVARVTQVPEIPSRSIVLSALLS